MEYCRKCRITKERRILAGKMAEGRILEARVTLCDSGHNLIVDLVSMKGIIPKEEGAIGIRTVLPKISP